MSLVLADKPDTFDRDRLYEQAASHYLDILDETGKAVRIPALAESLCEAHPNYDLEQVKTLLGAPEFETYLQTRRRTHLINSTAAKLVAAEIGSRIAVDALEELQQRIKRPGMKTGDLIALAKLGMDLNAGVDKDLTEITGDAKVTINLKNLLIGLPPERAAALMGEYGRVMASPQAKAEIIDADSDDTEE